MLFLILLVVTVVGAREYEFEPKLLEPTLEDGISEGDIVSGRMKRFVTIQSNRAQNAELKNRKLQADLIPCLTPDGRNGFCRHFRDCVMDEQKNDFVKLLDYLCIIHDTLGVCCPENSKRGGLQGIAGQLPAIAPLQERNNVALTYGIANRGCGLTTRSQIRLTGGQRIARANEWPWMASVSPQEKKIHCGGALITERHVVTAAHCVDKYEPRNLRVRLGEYDFKRKNDTRIYDFKVSEVHIHERYQSTIRLNDIAILKLSRQATFNSYVWPICLPQADSNFTGVASTLIGWGTQSFGGKTSNVLQEVSLPIWDLEKCISSHVEPVFQENICAGTTQGGKDACQYDSGGPLMYQSAGGRWMLIGVVSWGVRCAEPNHPGVYTRVDKYIPWIQRNTGV